MVSSANSLDDALADCVLLDFCELKRLRVVFDVMRLDPDDDDYLAYLDSLTLDQLLQHQDDNNVDVFVAIGKKYCRQRKFTRAEEYYKRALGLNPRDPWTNLYLGNLYFTWDKNALAIRYFEMAREMAPDIACPYWCLGDVYAAMRHDTTATALYEQAVSVDPHDEQAQRQLRAWNMRIRRP